MLDDALGEVSRGQEVVEFACGIPHLLKGGYTENASTGVDVHSLRQPVGPAAIISPVQLPGDGAHVVLPGGHRAPATPWCSSRARRTRRAANWMAELWKEAGLPDGVFNVVHGDKESVDALLEHPEIKSDSFVGSTPIARYVYERGTAYGKRVQALGGAKNHMLVLPDADLDLAADAAVNAGYGSAGERCMAISAVVAVGIDRRRAGGQDRRPHRGAPRRRRRARHRHGAAGHGSAPRQGGRLHRGRCGRRCRTGAGRTYGGTGCRGRRLLARPDAVRPRHAGDVHLHRRDLRSGAVRGARAGLRRGGRR